MNKKLLLILSLILIVLSAGFGMYSTSLAKEPGPLDGLIRRDKRPSVVSMGEFITNLNDPYGRRFIKVSVNLEVSDSKSAREVQQGMAAARDAVLKVLRSKTAEDVAGEKGMRVLAEDILKGLNSLTPAGSVLNVYFADFAVQ